MLVTENGKIVMMDGGDYSDKDTVLNLIRSYKTKSIIGSFRITIATTYIPFYVF